MIQRTVATSIVISLFACGVSAQDDSSPESAPTSRPESAPTTRPESAPTKALVSDPEAAAYFRKAVVDQTLGDPPFELRDLQADLRATVYEKGEDGVRRPRTANVVEFWRAASATVGERYRRDLIEPMEGKETIHGFDGSVFWERLGKNAPRELRGREDRETLRRLRTELSRTNDLAASLLLSKLDAEDAVFTFVPDPKTLVVDGVETAVVRVRRERGDEAPIDLYFSGREIEGKPRVVLSGYRRRPTPKGPEEMLTFAVHRVLGKPGARLVTPTVVETYEDGELVLVGRAKEADLKFNVGLEDTLFAPPRR